MSFQAGCKTTAMGIMPHSDVNRALELALGLDIPFWPQLPNLSFHEDMYVQTSLNFPGIVVNLEEKKISFSTTKFELELGGYSTRIDEPETFALSREYSTVYHKFLDQDLRGYTAIRGQVTGPVSFGFRVVDEDNKPIIYHDGIKSLLYDFVQKNVNVQYQALKEKNASAFVWLDEPGLGWVFSGLSGYNDMQARQDYQDFLAGLDGPKALHLCANVNLPYLLGLGIELLSFDAYQIEVMPRGYVKDVADFLNSGGVIAWGIVPTDSTNLGGTTPETLAELLCGYWEVISSNSSLSGKKIAEQALIAPARCCLKNAGQAGSSDDRIACQSEGGPNLTVEEQLVEKALSYVSTISAILKDRFNL
ncbi:hypothetical protein ACFLWY_02000 [Chloroflexota bacterium]